MEMHIIPNFSFPAYLLLPIIAVFAGWICWYVIRINKLNKYYKALFLNLYQGKLDEEKQGNKNEAVLLLNSSFKLIGCSEKWYEYTNMKELKENKTSIEDIAFMLFHSSSSIDEHIKELKLLMQKGNGQLRIKLMEAAEIQEYILKVHKIDDGQEIIAYYLSLSPFYTKEQQLQYKQVIQQAEQLLYKFKQMTLFNLYLDGISPYFKEVSQHQLLALIETELRLEEQYSKAFIYNVGIGQYFVLIMQKLEKAEIKRLAEAMIETIHYIVGSRSTDHFVTVNIAIRTVALASLNGENVQSIISDTNKMLETVNVKEQNGYYIHIA